MKKIVILLLGIVLLVGCNNSPQGKAEASVKKHLKQSVRAYEPISFGVLDTLDVSEDPVYKVAKDSLSKSLAELKVTSDQFVLAAHQQAAKRNKVIVDELESFYSNKKFKLNHKYRGNTAEGKNEEIDKDFYLTGGFMIVE